MSIEILSAGIRDALADREVTDLQVARILSTLLADSRVNVEQLLTNVQYLRDHALRVDVSLRSALDQFHASLLELEKLNGNEIAGVNQFTISVLMRMITAQSQLINCFVPTIAEESEK